MLCVYAPLLKNGLVVAAQGLKKPRLDFVFNVLILNYYPLSNFVKCFPVDNFLSRMIATH